MALLTTAIGAFPKPSYVEIPDWFTGAFADVFDAADLPSRMPVSAAVTTTTPGAIATNDTGVLNGINILERRAVFGLSIPALKNPRAQPRRPPISTHVRAVPGPGLV